MYWALNLVFIKSLVAGFILSLLMTCHVHSREIESDLQAWAPIWFEMPVSEKVKTTFEVQPRLGDGLQNSLLSYVRPSVTYTLRPGLEATAGYLWTPYYKTGVMEHRAWEQLAYKHSIKKLNLLHQARIEQRFIENQYETSVRGRHMLMATYPIPKLDKYSAVMFNEVHFNLNDTNANPLGFNQNRTFAGIRRQLGPGFIETGYLLQLVKGFNASPHQVNHVWYTRLLMPLWQLGNKK